MSESIDVINKGGWSAHEARQETYCQINLAVNVWMAHKSVKGRKGCI
uniref:Uncharacterized protein n=1 Tax=Anguilla anguilla TaxID=7936 RepID=A0A0E9RJ06_ANGAN